MDSVVLIGGALAGSFISGMAGMGGGTLLIAIMSTVMTAPLLIPAHGIVQIGSNVSRVFLNFKHIDFKIGAIYILGAIIGTLIGINLNFEISQNFTGIVLGSFIIVTTWVSLEKLRKIKLLSNYAILGVLSTILSLFVGVAGPLVHPFILKEKHLGKYGFIGTESLCAGTTHILKMIIFSIWGVSLLPYWEILMAMIAATFIGTYLGKLTIRRVLDKKYKLIIKLFITVLALRLVFSAI